MIPNFSIVETGIYRGFTRFCIVLAVRENL